MVLCDTLYKRYDADNRMISRGLVFETEEEAKIMTKALFNYKENHDTSNFVDLTLPRPILKPTYYGDIFIITKNFHIAQEVYKGLNHQVVAVDSGRAFRSREDAKAWLEAFKNSRK